MSTIYNIIIKNLFLNKFENEDTKKVYQSIFKKSEALESKYSKDIYNFQENLLIEFIKDILKPKTKESARTYCNILSSYIQWAIEEKHSSHLTNPIRKKQEFFYEFVQNEKLYISYTEKEDILSGLRNSQDQFVLQGLWEGIEGTKVSELVNLELDDFKTENGIDFMVHVGKGTNKERIIPVEAKTFTIARLANNEDMYYKKNGIMEEDGSVLRTYVELPQTKYVLKSQRSKANMDRDTISYSTIYNRVELIKSLEEFEDYKEALTTKNIVRSGMIYEAYKIVKSGRLLNKQSIEEICEKYGIKYKWSLKDFLNIETITQLYGDLPNAIYSEVL